jgi:hypothetical protein
MTDEEKIRREKAAEKITDLVLKARAFHEEQKRREQLFRNSLGISLKKKKD